MREGGRGCSRHPRRAQARSQRRLQRFRYEPSPNHLGWLQNLRERSLAARSAFVHEQANIAGKVLLGDHVRAHRRRELGSRR